jgi:hypothetical protein
VSNQHTTDEIFSPIGPPTPEGPTTRFIDIHIYEQEPEREEPPSIESKLEQEPAPPDESNQEQEHTEPARPHHKQRSSIIALCVGIMCLSVVITLVIVSLLPLLTPDTTITIVPSTQQIRIPTSIIVNTGQAAGTQLQGRALAAITMNQARTVPTTGKSHLDAKAGQGYITFYNAATYAQTVAAGTLLTGNDGVQVVTDQDATIPAANYPTFGQASVPAQAVITGPGGNLQAGDIYGSCCRLNVSAVNSAFGGGLQARDYQTVTQQDINTVVNNLKTSLNQSVQAALQTQVHSDETLITPLSCQQSSKPDHKPGDEATQVQITVSETCTGTTYNTQAYQSYIIQIANQQAGDGYIPVGQIQSTIQAIHQEHNRTELHINIAQTYAYQVSQQQQQDIKALVAGKSKAQATSILLHTPGLQSVSVSSATIPTDTKHIRVIVVYV